MKWRELFDHLTEEQMDLEVVVLDGDTQDLAQCRFSEIPSDEARGFGLVTVSDMHPILLFDARNFLTDTGG